jgi:hypothetical protein
MEMGFLRSYMMGMRIEFGPLFDEMPIPVRED